MKGSFYRNEHYINDRIIAVTHRTNEEALMEEIKQTVEEQLNDKIDSQFIARWLILLKHKEYDKAKQICANLRITTSYDMGWQRRSIGRVYDSLFRHGYMIGCTSGKFVSMGVMNKKCSTCSSHNKRSIEPSVHNYIINHTASSGRMEAKLCEDLITKIYNGFQGCVVVGGLVTNDDSTIRSRCKNEIDSGRSIG